MFSCFTQKLKFQTKTCSCPDRGSKVFHQLIILLLVVKTEITALNFTNTVRKYKFLVMPSELSPVLGTPDAKTPNKLHYLALVSVTLAELGDSVEFMIPAVITQLVSCELGLFKQKEQMLALVLFISAAFCSIATIPFLKRFPRKPIILFSLYLSVISSVVCAVMPDYTSLIVSRILLGMTIAVSMTPLSVYLSEISPNQEFYALATVVKSIGYSTGGGWCGIISYLFLERIGWRWFVLLTSVPIFLFPIIAFQFILPESKKSLQESKQEKTNKDQVTTRKLSMVLRILKLSILNALRVFPYVGGILLLPAIFKEDNKRYGRGGPCNTIHGTQFLVVSLLFGVCHIIGKVVGYTVNKLTAVVSFILFSISTTTAALVTLFNLDRVAVLVVCLCVVQISLPALSTELDILSYDSFFFTKSYLPVASAVRLAVDFLSSLATNVLSEVL